jgi:predicted dienelactone hydrolase
MHRPVIRSAAVAVVAALALAACGGDDDTSTAAPPTAANAGGDATTTTPATSTIASTTSVASTSTTVPATVATTVAATVPATEPTVPSEPGPYPVGVLTLQLPTGNAVEVWYPAADGTTGTDTYEMRDFVPEAVRALLTSDEPAGYTSPSARDAAPATPPAGGFPVVAVSHGAASIRFASSFLTSHLASWGMVVVAPDHPARDLASRLGGAVETPPDPVDDLAGSIDLVVDESAPGGRLAGLVDAERVALIGHSAGGGTILGLAARDPRVDGYVSMASGRLGEDTAPMPAVPSFFLAGSVDAIVPADERTGPAYEAAPAPSRYWLIDGAGHNSFDDFCTFGGGTGIIGVADASGLSGLLDAVPGLRALGEDGCVPPALPVEETFPVVRHGITVWLLDLFGAADGIPTDLGPDVGELYGVTVTVESKP